MAARPRTERSDYHHGSLRSELITACVRLVEAEGVAAVNLRRIAREAGVSSGAPYHHFPDRASLLAAVHQHAGETLERHLRHAAERVPEPIDQLAALLHAYVVFARDNRGLAHLLLRPEMAALDAHPSASEPGIRSVALLREVVAACQRTGTAPPGDPEVVVALVWALMVGFVSLWLDGPIATRCAELDRTPTELSQQVIGLLQSLLRG